MTTVNLFYDKNGVLRSNRTGKEIKLDNAPTPPPPPPKKVQQYIKVNLQTATIGLGVVQNRRLQK